jgi:hypothetical protein
VIPLRTIVALDEGIASSGLTRALEGAGLEVFRTSGAPRGWMLLGRVHPDLLVLDPSCGGGRAEDWRRAIARFRRSRALGLLVVSPSATIRALFSSDADLGVYERLPSPKRLLEILEGFGGESESMREAS